MKINYRIDINLSKRKAHMMIIKYRGKKFLSKKIYTKKDRASNRIKNYEE